ncbi:MAG: putative E3 ubiquitin-protein ligase [Bogoriella megaspora]|nr:MAG: putative E3 ubiquitin-protein ligase [Bogoriella megaspora]
MVSFGDYTLRDVGFGAAAELCPGEIVSPDPEPLSILDKRISRTHRNTLVTSNDIHRKSHSQADNCSAYKMGALKYVEELQKKKQSDVLRFLLRVRCWELRQLNVIHRASRPSRPDKARRLGYKAKQGYVIYRVRVRRGGRKRPVPKGATYGKPTNQGVNQLKYQRSLRSTAEERVGRRCANLRVLNSYWINQDSTYKYYEVILVDPQHKAIRNDSRINWIVKPVHKVRLAFALIAHILANYVYSTVKRVVLRLLARNLVGLAGVISSTTRRRVGERFGRNTTLCLSGGIAEDIVDEASGRERALEGNHATKEFAISQLQYPLLDATAKMAFERLFSSLVVCRTGIILMNVEIAVDYNEWKCTSNGISVSTSSGAAMPSWPPRFLSNTNATSSSTQPPSNRSNPAGRDKPLPRPAGENLQDHPGVQIPRRTDSLSRSHSRSISHSLSIFRKRSTGKAASGLGIDSSSDDDLVLAPEDILSASPSRKGTVGSKAKAEEQETTVHRCMTCDTPSQVPKGMLTFKCATCVAINDLQVRSWRPTQIETQDEQGESSTATSNLAPTRKALPISIERTTAIIDQCIVNYLQGKRPLTSQTSNQSGGPSAKPLLPRENEPRTQAESSGSGAFSSRRQPNNPLMYDKSKPRSSTAPESIPARPTRDPPPPPIQLPKASVNPSFRPNVPSPRSPEDPAAATTAKSIFKELEEYVIQTYGRFDCLNTSFSASRPALKGRTRSESSVKSPLQRTATEAASSENVAGIDAKTLLLGNFAENGAWWSGREDDVYTAKDGRETASSSRSGRLVSSKTPYINWEELSAWYDLVLHASRNWREKSKDLTAKGISDPLQRDTYLIERDFREAQHHVNRVLLKATETLLRRPGRPLRRPDHLRFLLILLDNPLLYPTGTSTSTTYESRKIFSDSGKSQGQHPGIVKRIVGLLANTPPDCHRYCAGWFTRYSEDHLQQTIDLIGRFVTYRLTRQNDRNKKPVPELDDGLVPDITASNADTSAQLYSALGLSGSAAHKKGQQSTSNDVPYSEDWQLRAAAKVMGLLFVANNSYFTKKAVPVNTPLADTTPVSSGVAARQRARTHGQLVPTSDFYITLLDYMNLVADFELWETKRPAFCFCQYPFFLSIGAKIRILEHDAKRQMEIQAREAFFEAIMNERDSVGHYFMLQVRRACLVEDSLQQISAAVGASGNEVKKGLKVQFVGEEGVDVGGLRKEWFLLLIREIFDPDHGLFIYDDDSKFCYFNPYSFETSAQYFLVGVAIGLAIYNSTILDVALPPFTFKKLLASSPPTTNAPSPSRASLIKYTLSDLAEYRPALAAGLQQLLDYEGDVESTYCRDFVASIDRYGSNEDIPLCPNGGNIPVTNSNRQEFVDLYVRYLLDTAVSRQFEPFKRGFFTVCGGNALSLFRPEEIELLVRGSDEPLDVSSIRAVAVYDGWSDPRTGTPIKNPDSNIGPPEDLRPAVPVVRWFWESFENATPADQRRLLSFITGSDRIPATGAANLVMRISSAGVDETRYPTARTCFNRLALQWYRKRATLESKLWEAVRGSEGFGLK